MEGQAIVAFCAVPLPRADSVRKGYSALFNEGLLVVRKVTLSKTRVVEENNPMRYDEPISDYRCPSCRTSMSPVYLPCVRKLVAWIREVMVQCEYA